MRSRSIILAIGFVLVVLAGLAALSPTLQERLGIDALLHSDDVTVTGSTGPQSPPPSTEMAASPEADDSQADTPPAQTSAVEPPLVETPQTAPSPAPPAVEPTESEEPDEPAMAAVPPTPRMLTISRSADRVSLSGGIAQAQTRDALIEAAMRAFPTSGIETSLDEVADLPEGHDEAGLAAIAALSRLAEGRARISDGEIAVSGRSLYAQGSGMIEERTASLTPEGWALSLDIEAPERAAESDAARCQRLLSEQLADRQIGFAVAAATLEADAEPIIDDLAQAASDCPDTVIEIAGHTDSDGSASANETLSRERASAVRDALVERGVEAERLRAVGYGQTRPIAPNDTPENKARNRRIELVVIE